MTVHALDMHDNLQIVITTCLHHVSDLYITLYPNEYNEIGDQDANVPHVFAACGDQF